MEARIVLVTCRKDDSKGIASALVQEKLAACVNIIPGLTSLYWWEGKVAEDAEELLVIKTTKDLIPPLEAAVKRLHPYDTPEFMVIDPEKVEDRYLAWLQSAVKR